MGRVNDKLRWVKRYLKRTGKLKTLVELDKDIKEKLKKDDRESSKPSFKITKNQDRKNKEDRHEKKDKQKRERVDESLTDKKQTDDNKPVRLSFTIQKAPERKKFEFEPAKPKKKELKKDTEEPKIVTIPKDFKKIAKKFGLPQDHLEFFYEYRESFNWEIKEKIIVHCTEPGCKLNVNKAEAYFLKNISSPLFKMIVFVQSLALCLICIFALEKSRQVDVLLSKQTRQQLEFQSGVGQLRFEISSLENEISKLTEKSTRCDENLRSLKKDNEDLVSKLKKSCLRCQKSRARLEKQRFRFTVKVFVQKEVPLHQEALESLESRVSQLRQIALEVENDILKKFTNLTHKLHKEKSSHILLNQKSCPLTQISSTNKINQSRQNENSELPDFASEYCGATVIKEKGTYKSFGLGRLMLRNS
ncbi:Oidioi.mRNA.OKI2018_I69.chr1.g1609.t1.cds [Oikopleura dioica]|uniref:Oidioi.mRNA.OKI2018_I69.chr1.g1609.t1.cds n=1 Tax=Oikopleura dioica TaxID=34765 RepID=A0ABN7SRZ4_OIKDI|nr:Oidioi.mRNA.OKI2018_I69.chr1.g1609.t1.cds [Oikopleura dioica]